MPIRDYLLAIAIFVNGAKGHSALQLSRDLDCQYKTAFVLAHKIREALASETNGATVSGEVEIDGAYFGGHVQPGQSTGSTAGPSPCENQTGKRHVVVIMRERGGRTLAFVFKSEAASVVTIARTRCARQHRLCRRSLALGRARCSLPDEADQSLRSYSTAKPAPIKRSRFSLACAAPKSAFTTISPGRTCQPTRAKWLGEKTTAA